MSAKARTNLILELAILSPFMFIALTLLLF